MSNPNDPFGLNNLVNTIINGSNVNGVNIISKAVDVLQKASNDQFKEYVKGVTATTDYFTGTTTYSVDGKTFTSTQSLNVYLDERAKKVAAEKAAAKAAAEKTAAEKAAAAAKIDVAAQAIHNDVLNHVGIRLTQTTCRALVNLGYTKQPTA